MLERKKQKRSLPQLFHPPTNQPTSQAATRPAGVSSHRHHRLQTDAELYRRQSMEGRQASGLKEPLWTQEERSYSEIDSLYRLLSFLWPVQFDDHHLLRFVSAFFVAALLHKCTLLVPDIHLTFYSPDARRRRPFCVADWCGTTKDRKVINRTTLHRNCLEEDPRTGFIIAWRHDSR